MVPLLVSLCCGCSAEKEWADKAALVLGDASQAPGNPVAAACGANLAAWALACARGSAASRQRPVRAAAQCRDVEQIGGLTRQPVAALQRRRLWDECTAMSNLHIKSRGHASIKSAAAPRSSSPTAATSVCVQVPVIPGDSNASSSGCMPDTQQVFEELPHWLIFFH